ncbi:hypothetical protein EV401DRAFT_458337 [Pisolithus croceorrhizus]|nr:hypothetical protein EV401DRAFT_458337 [Pisolithus croceorrhizus]
MQNDRTGLAMPGLMDTVSGSYLLELDGWPATVNECFGQWIALGDYGDYSGGIFICTGNIFEDIQAAGIDLDDSHCPAVTSVSSSDLGKQMDWVKDQDDLAVAYSFTSETYLALHQPKAFSLSVDERISLLLNYLSTRLAGKHLVTTIIRCSDFYMVDEDGKRRDSDSAPDSGNHSAETKILTPLCVIACPHFWSKEPLHKPRTELFKSIRKKFYALMDMVRRFTPLGSVYITGHTICSITPRELNHLVILPMDRRKI